MLLLTLLCIHVNEKDTHVETPQYNIVQVNTTCDYDHSYNYNNKG